MTRALLALAVVLTGCAPTLKPLPATSTAVERQQADTCHAFALKELDRAPGFLATWGQHALRSGGDVAFAPVLLATSPVWFPIAKTRHDQAIYDAAFDRCMIHGASEVVK